MNISIATSFIVGGLLLLALITLNNRVMVDSSRATIDLINKYKIDNVRRLISQDFKRMGYGLDGDDTAPDSVIVSFNPPHKINFKADLFGNGAKVIMWHFLPNTHDNDTSNPDDRILQRNGPTYTSQSNSVMEMTVVDFRLTGFEDTGGETETTDKNEIKSILVEVVYESAEPVELDAAGNPVYHRASWRRLFVPNNMQFTSTNTK